MPVLGYRVNICDRLRLWRADATESFDFYAFNIGDYGAVEEKVGSETLSKVLYPNDGTDEGQRLRLKQQHFFVSCSLQDMLRSLDNRGLPIEDFPEYWTVQLNDTHPAIAVAELMRLLIDDRRMQWEKAWDITSRSVAYTNHTLLPEALEKWDLDLFGSLLPRHLELIYEINRHSQQLRLRYPGNDAIQRKLSIIDEEGSKAVRMAHLATIGAHHSTGGACTPIWSKPTCCRNSLRSGPKSSPMSPTGSPRGAGWPWPIRLSQLLDEHVGSDWISNMEKLRSPTAPERPGLPNQGNGCR